MPSADLLQFLKPSDARLAQYLGAEAVASFGDPQAELKALLTGAGLSFLSWKAKLVFTGEDRVRWTNGMVTNNVRDLAYGYGNYNFVLNAQGRIQGDITVYNRGEYLLGVTTAAQATGLREFLDRFIVMDDVEITDVSEKLASVGVSGPKALSVLSAAGLDAAALAPGQVIDAEFQGVGYSIARAIATGDAAPESYELWFASENAEKFWNALTAAGAMPVGCEALEWLRILQGVPLYGVDLTDRELAQETGQKHALHFSKGCYIGQEIVERIRSRGNVHRTFVGFASEEPAETKSKVVFEGKEVGEVTSSAMIPLPNGPRALELGFVRREAATPGTQVTSDGHALTVKELPFKSANGD